MGRKHGSLRRPPSPHHSPAVRDILTFCCLQFVSGTTSYYMYILLWFRYYGESDGFLSSLEQSALFNIYIQYILYGLGDPLCSGSRLRPSFIPCVQFAQLPYKFRDVVAVKLTALNIVGTLPNILIYFFDRAHKSTCATTGPLRNSDYF